MEILKTLILVINVICCLLLIGLILLQRAKNEGLGLAFGAGAGEALFGARAGNVLTKATVFLGIVFMASTLILGILYARPDTAEQGITISGGQGAVAPVMPVETGGASMAPPINTSSMDGGEVLPAEPSVEVDELPESN